MAKFNRKSIFAATGSLAAVMALTALRHSANAQVPTTPPPAAAPTAPTTPAAPALPPLVPSGPIGPAKIGTLNLSRVFQDSKQLASAKADLENRGKNNAAIANGNQATLNKAQDERNHMKVGSDQWKQATADLQKMSLQFQMAEKLEQIEMQHAQSEAIKATFDAVSAASKQVAATKGLDLVLVDNGDDIPAGATELAPDALSNLIQSHSILYASPKIDITADVEAQLDIAAKTPVAPAAPGH